jgi:hypothetical protein
VGLALGEAVGLDDGDTVGLLLVGASVGAVLGIVDGAVVGRPVGC